jgi:diguanylate cyclase (GGDEF)-like protein
MQTNSKPLYARTGLFRRRPIEINIDRFIENIEESGDGHLSMALLDIDGFTAIEERYGYAFADRLLDTIAEHMQSISEADIAERYVRDSFVLVYDGLMLEDAFLRAETVRKALAKHTFTVMNIDGQPVELGVEFSAGVSAYPGDADNRNQLLSLAENAAKQALNLGGSRIAFGRPQSMTPKTSHYSPSQLERLKALGKRLKQPEAELLREALDDLLRKYDQRDYRREDVDSVH